MPLQTQTSTSQRSICLRWHHPALPNPKQAFHTQSSFGQVQLRLLWEAPKFQFSSCLQWYIDSSQQATLFSEVQISVLKPNVCTSASCNPSTSLGWPNPRALTFRAAACPRAEACDSVPLRAFFFAAFILSCPDSTWSASFLAYP